MSLQYIELAPLFQDDGLADVFGFTNQVDRTFCGLGIPTLYGVLSILANKSVFFIGKSGTGKTTLIDLIPEVNNTKVTNWDTFTYGGLSNHFNGPIENDHLVYKVQEFSTLSDYHRDIFLKVCCKIASDKQFTHNARSTKIDVSNCKLTMLVAIQPRLYSNLCNRNVQWETMSYDRFSKFVLLNPLRHGTVKEKNIPTLPREMSTPAEFNDRYVDISDLVSLFRGHVSSGRAENYARDYSIAYSSFLGDTQVRQSHIDGFFRLFSPYLNSFSILQRAKDLDSPVTVSSGELKLLGEIANSLEAVTKQHLTKELFITEKSIERPSNRLLEVGLIEKPKPATYRLSKDLRDFFEWYQSKIDFPP